MGRQATRPVRDVIESPGLMDALVAATEAAATARRAKDGFLAIMSHELRTPMNGIFGMTELALDTSDDAERRDYLLRARECANTLMNTLDDVLTFAYIENEALRTAHDEVEPGALLESVITALAPMARRKGIALGGSVDGCVPHRMKGDRFHFQQILMRIAGNALKFTEHGAVDILMDLDPGVVETGAVHLRCAVCDTGIGISPGQCEYIFEAFVQGDNSTTRRYPGIGLGLAIARQLVQHMSGRMEVQSEPGCGSRFRFTARFAAMPDADMTLSDDGATRALPGHAT